jgi:YD repeat-containing protein
MTVLAPSGAQGVFDFTMELFVRSDPCNGLQPAYYDTWALKARTITGPGLPEMVTLRSYKLQLPGNERGKWVSQTRADGTQIRERYGTDPASDERKLLQRQVLDPAGQVLRDEQHTYLHGAAGGPFMFRVGRSLGLMSGQFLAGTLTAMKTSQVMQDGDTYDASFDGFDRYTRAHTFTYSGPSGLRTELREYHDSAIPWVLDQVLRVREASTGRVTAEYAYDAMAKPVASYRAGVLQQAVVYGAGGNVAAVRDGIGNATMLKEWHRGVPQRVVNADGTSTQMRVDDNGWITAVTNASGHTTSYGYDPLGRVNEIRPPADNNAWLSTALSFRQMPVAEFGLGPGHWRVDTAHGSRRDETYLDALWRPVVTRSYDANDMAATERLVRTMFDSEGREVFRSHPARTSDAPSGIWTQHDSLGRATSTGEDSELGVLLTTYSYLPRATVLRTDPAGHNTITQFHAIDAPDYEKPSHIIRPDGSRIRITRNALGLTTDVAQSAN